MFWGTKKKHPQQHFCTFFRKDFNADAAALCIWWLIFHRCYTYTDQVKKWSITFRIPFIAAIITTGRLEKARIVEFKVYAIVIKDIFNF